MKVCDSLGQIVFLVFATFLEIAQGNTFSFCAQNQNFVFSEDACPGGILFKSAVTINETCHCFPSDVAIYPSCISALDKDNTVPVHIPHSVTSCSRSPSLESQQVQLLIPLGSKSPSTKSTFCPYIPSSCASKPHNQALKSPLVQEFEKMGQISEGLGTKITDTLDADNQQPQQIPPIPIVESYDDNPSLKNYMEASLPNVEPSLLPPDGNEDSSSSIIANSRSVFRSDTVESIDDEPTDKNNDELQKKPVIPMKPKEKIINELFSISDIDMFAENDNSLTEKESKVYKRMSDAENENNTFIDEDNGKDYVLRALVDKLAGEIIEDDPPYVSESKGASLMHKTSEMFKQLAPNEIIQDSIVDDIFRTFVSSHLFGNGYVSTHNDYITDDMYYLIMNGLSLCQNRDEGFSEYVFESDKSCPPVVQKFINMKTKKAISVSELHNKLPKSFEYLPEKENFIVGLMWKMIDAIHAECFGTWLSYDASIPIFYYSFLEHFFLQDDVITLFENESVGTSRYNKVIESDKALKEIAFNVDTLVAAIHSKSQFPNFFSKPSPKNLNGDKESGPGSDSNSDDDDDTNSSESNNTNDGDGDDGNQDQDVEDINDDDFIRVKLRRRRSLAYLDLEAFEIWGGTAYCLQKMDNTLPSSVDNTFPRIPQMCQVQ